MSDLFHEARQDIKDIKSSLASMDKNLSLAVLQLQGQKDSIAKLEDTVQAHDKHVSLVNTIVKFTVVLVSTVLSVLKISSFFR